MEWPPDFYAQLTGAACPMCEQGRPEQDPPPIPDERLRAEVGALRRAMR